MAEKITCENERISNFQGLGTLTLDRVILHTIVHHSSTSTYTPNFIEIELFVDVRMYRQMNGWKFEIALIMATQKSRPKN